jgi:hypothetical protein
VFGQGDPNCIRRRCAFALVTRFSPEKLICLLNPFQLPVKLATDQFVLQTGVRGYLIAGDERFLEPYRTGVAAVRVRFGSLADVSGCMKESPLYP